MKQDTVGRIRTPRDRREALLAEFDRSGMSGQKFAARAGIKYTTFANWLQQRRKQERAQPAPATQATAALQWVEAVVSTSAPAKAGAGPETALIVHGRCGVRIEIHRENQADWAAKLLRQLDGPGPC